MWTLAVLVFASCLWVIYLTLARLMGPRLAVAERLSLVTEASRSAGPTAGRYSDLPTAERLMGRLSISQALERLLDEADLPVKPFEFILILIVAALGGGLVGLFVSQHTGLAVLLGGVGFLIPLVWVRLRRSWRREAFSRQLPDAMQAIGNALRAGYGFGQGMAVVANDLPRPISSEFARALREMNLGLTAEDVLQTMARRVQNLDFDLAVAGILINRQVGGNLAELLDHVTATIRERVKLKAFVRVLTAEQRLSAVVIMAVPPVLLVILLTAWREYMSFLLVTRVGQILLAISIGLQLLGVYFIRRIVAIEV